MGRGSYKSSALRSPSSPALRCVTGDHFRGTPKLPTDGGTRIQSCASFSPRASSSLIAQYSTAERARLKARVAAKLGASERSARSSFFWLQLNEQTRVSSHIYTTPLRSLHELSIIRLTPPTSHVPSSPKESRLTSQQLTTTKKESVSVLLPMTFP